MEYILPDYHYFGNFANWTEYLYIEGPIIFYGRPIMASCKNYQEVISYIVNRLIKILQKYPLSSTQEIFIIDLGQFKIYIRMDVFWIKNNQTNFKLVPEIERIMMYPLGNYKIYAIYFKYDQMAENMERLLNGL
jgi:hypothetical protein